MKCLTSWVIQLDSRVISHGFPGLEGELVIASAATLHILCWLLLVNYTQAQVTWEEGNSIEELLPSDLHPRGQFAD